MFESITIIISLAALFGYINYKLLKLPTTVGLMILALCTAGIMVLVRKVNQEFFYTVCAVVETVDFKTVLLDFMLSFLLFAGALHTNLRQLLKQKTAIITFATLGVLISTFTVAVLLYLALQLIGYPLDFIYCLLFGSLISPTDPIAVLAIFRQSKVDKNLELKISGESLFNDGIGVVVFTTIYMIVEEGTNSFAPLEVLEIFGVEALGGMIFGLALGFLGYYMLKSVNDNPKIEVIITVAMALGGYSLASYLHLSGPLAMVVAGLLLGSKLETCVFSENSRKHLEYFWEMLDDLLNAVLFVLIGLEILVLTFEHYYLWAGLAAILAVLVGRITSVSLPMMFLHPKGSRKNTTAVMIWGGLRGGISVALALSLSGEIDNRELIVCITYIVVVFSIIVQGMTIGKLVKKLGVIEE